MKVCLLDATVSRCRPVGGEVTAHQQSRLEEANASMLYCNEESFLYWFPRELGKAAYKLFLRA